MAWLDALRGIAALLVVYEHLSHFVLTGVRRVVEPWFLSGYAGVSLFFLISGYIIPASLERKGSLRGFWVGRIFRLYPMFLVVLGVLVVLHVLGVRPLDPAVLAHRAAVAVGQVTMMPSLLDTADLLPVTWTLAFEMAFYLLVAALFATRLHRHSAAVALVFAGTALVAGGSVPVLLVTNSLGTRTTIVAVTVAFAAVLVAMLGNRPRLAIAGAVAGGLLGAVLVVTNQEPVHHWDGLMIPALMFTGTTFYRAERREISRWWALIVPLAVAGIWFLQGAREAGGGGPWEVPHPHLVFRFSSLVTTAIVALLFGTGFALRHKRIPRVLAWLGLVSYSVYLLHLVVLQTIEPVIAGHRPGPLAVPFAVQVGVAVLLVGLILGVSALTYRFVEAPAQRYGHRLAKWLEARYPNLGSR